MSGHSLRKMSRNGSLAPRAEWSLSGKVGDHSVTMAWPRRTMREMGPTGSSADPLVFRKLLFRNDDNASRRETACPGPQVNAIRRGDLTGRDDQEEWATCGSLTGPPAPRVRELTRTSSSSRVRRRTGPS